MPRYEDATTFWQVARAGATVTVTSGKLGNKGRTSARSLPTPAEAKAHYETLVRDKLRAGFAVVEAPDPEPAPADAEPDDRLAELEARIAEDPDDVASWQVYGDLLQRRGDPHGELGALQRAAEASAKAKVIAARFFGEHVGALLGPLVRHVRDVRDLTSAPFTWRHGFVRRADLDDGAIVGELLGHPSGRLVVELALKLPTAMDFDHVADGLASHPPPALQELDVLVRDELGDIDALWQHVPRLRRLAVTARAFDIDALVLPELQRLRFAAWTLTGSCVGAIARAALPNLERLELRLGTQGALAHTPVEFADLEALLARADLPALSHLKIRHAPFAGAIVRVLARGPLASQLQVLDLSHGTITPRDVEVLAQAKQRFTNLRELWLPAAALWGNGPQLLAGIAKHVVSDARAPLDMIDQDLAGDARRYVEVTE